MARRVQSRRSILGARYHLFHPAVPEARPDPARPLHRQPLEGRPDRLGPRVLADLLGRRFLLRCFLREVLEGRWDQLDQLHRLVPADLQVPFLLLRLEVPAIQDHLSHRLRRGIHSLRPVLVGPAFRPDLVGRMGRARPEDHRFLVVLRGRSRQLLLEILFVRAHPSHRSLHRRHPRQLDPQGRLVQPDRPLLALRRCPLYPVRRKDLEVPLRLPVLSLQPAPVDRFVLAHRPLHPLPLDRPHRGHLEVLEDLLPPEHHQTRAARIDSR